MPRSRAYLSLALAIVLALAFAAPALGVTSSDLSAHQAAADAARKRAAAANALAADLMRQTAVLDKQIEGLQVQADALNPKIAETTARTARLRAEVESLRAQVAAKRADIAKTQAQYKVEQQLLSNRIESTYKQGNWFYIEMLLGSQNIGDLITRTEFVSRVIESNNDIAKQLSGTKDMLERAKVALDRTLETATVKRHQAEVVQSDLVQLRRSRQTKVDAQEAVLGQKATLLADTKENAKRQLALYKAELAESNRIAALLSGNGSGAFHGSMTWPVPSSHRITSNFGPRNCPFHGRENHSGIDIGAASGSPIVAAGAGKVIDVHRSSSYGNMVMIDHGNGVVTLYAHQRDGGIVVHVGQRVDKGQRIGAVGSTGNSTGPHLHFEVRVNGTPRNPRNYTG